MLKLQIKDIIYGRFNPKHRQYGLNGGYFNIYVLYIKSKEKLLSLKAILRSFTSCQQKTTQ